jgi:hypothetical protein
MCWFNFWLSLFYISDRKMIVWFNFWLSLFCIFDLWCLSVMKRSNLMIWNQDLPLHHLKKNGKEMMLSICIDMRLFNDARASCKGRIWWSEIKTFLFLILKINGKSWWCVYLHRHEIIQWCLSIMKRSNLMIWNQDLPLHLKNRWCCP